MTKQSHTPTPWMVEIDDDATVYDANNQIIPILTDIPLGWIDTQTGNYRDPELDVDIILNIIRAVNSHDELVDALKKMISYSSYLLSELNLSDTPKIINDARKILAKAEE